MALKEDKTELLIRHLNDKTDQNYQGILSRVERLENTAIKTAEMQHYATKDFVWMKFWIVLGVVGCLAISVCTAYWLITPTVVDSRTNKINETINKIYDILRPKSDPE